MCSPNAPSWQFALMLVSALTLISRFSTAELIVIVRITARLRSYWRRPRWKRRVRRLPFRRSRKMTGDHPRNPLPMLLSLRCGDKTRSRKPCRSPGGNRKESVAECMVVRRDRALRAATRTR
jgi:hypothetical protein